LEPAGGGAVEADLFDRWVGLLTYSKTSLLWLAVYSLLFRGCDGRQSGIFGAKSRPWLFFS
jgi:hypothetical protein